MKITSIKPYIFNLGPARHLIFCRVETDEGIFGWGEGYGTQSKEKVVGTYIEALAPIIIGRSPFNIRHTFQALFDDIVQRRSGVDFFCAWSAIEIACWDIIGKATNQPIYNLLGGACREKIRVYANGWWGGSTSPEETAQRSLKIKEMGFSAMKFDPFPMPWRTLISKKDEDYAVATVKAVRQAVGAEVDLLVEVHRRLAPFHAIRFARRIEEFNPFWFEEPCLSDNVDLVAAVKREVHIPVVTGETIYTKAGFKEVFEKQAADIINPDSCICNGILGMLEIAAMAEPYAVAFSPHNANGTLVALAATVHLSAPAPNFLITEYFVNQKQGCDEIASKNLKFEDGYIDLPTSPGLGVDIDVEKLVKRPLDEKKPHRYARQYWEEFPRKGHV